MNTEFVMPDVMTLPEKVSVTEKRVKTSDGVELRILDFKPGTEKPENPVIAFVAGWISLIQGWQEVLNTLTPMYRTLYIETREKISAKLPDSRDVAFTIQRMSQDIHEVLDQLLPENQAFYFAGSSLGSTTLLHYLSTYPRQPAKSLLIAPLCEFHIPSWGIFLVRLAHPSMYIAIKPFIKWYLRNFRLDKKNEPEQVAKYEGTIDAADPARLKKNALSIKDFSLWNHLPDIPSPVIIIGAETDTLHGVDTMEKMIALIPNARLEMMKSNKDTHSEKAGLLMLEHIGNNKIQESKTNE